MLTRSSQIYARERDDRAEHHEVQEAQHRAQRHRARVERPRLTERRAQREQHNTGGDHLHRGRRETATPASASGASRSSRTPTRTRRARAHPHRASRRGRRPSPSRDRRARRDPSSPSARPATTRRVGRRPWGRSQSISTMKHGTVPTSSAAMPDGTRCSDQTTSPLPPTKSSTPTIAVERQCARGRRRGSAEHTRPSIEQRARQQEPHARHQKRRQRLDREQDREVRRAPDDVDDGKRTRQREPGRRGCGVGAHGRAARRDLRRPRERNS